MEGQEEVPVCDETIERHGYSSSSTSNIEYSDDKPDLHEPSMAMHSTPEDLPHAAGDTFQHGPGMRDLDPKEQDEKLSLQGGPLLSREALNEQAQQLIEKINEKRNRDTNIIDDFRKVLLDKVALTCNTLLEERMYRVYEMSGKNMQPKLQEFFATLDRVAAIEQELEHFKQALGVLYTDIQQAKP